MAAEHLVKAGFGLALAEAQLKITPSQRVLSYLTQLFYLGEKAYSKKIHEDLRMVHVSGILGRLEKARWIKRKYEIVDGRRVKACYPTPRGEDVLEKCELPPYG